MASEDLPPPPHSVRSLADVPVYNCHVYLSDPDERGKVVARAASLPEVVAEGKSERDALRNIVVKFKEAIRGYTSRGEPIPWLAEANPPRTGERQRFVPVHF
jgi:predicted RNase H-like HicB family nuclease